MTTDRTPWRSAREQVRREITDRFEVWKNGPEDAASFALAEQLALDVEWLLVDVHELLTELAEAESRGAERERRRVAEELIADANVFWGAAELVKDPEEHANLRFRAVAFETVGNHLSGEHEQGGGDE